MTIGRSIVAKVSDMIYCEDMEFASASHLQLVCNNFELTCRNVQDEILH